MNPETPLVTGPGEPGLVSAIIPTYNRAYILGEAIESVLRQTYRPVEVVVLDDGSSDNTREVVEAFGPPVRYFRQANAGVSAARNAALRRARGEFIALLDSDDSWLPWKLAAQVQFLRRFPDVGMVWTDMVAVDETGARRHDAYLRKMYSAHRKVRIEDILELSGRLAEFSPDAPADVSERLSYRGELFSYMLMGSLVHTSTVLLRRERATLVGGFDESKRTGEDYEFHLRTCFHGPVGFLDASSILYRVGASDQLTAPHLAVQIARNYLRTLSHWVERGRDRIVLPPHEVRRQLAEAFRWVGEEELTANNPRGARRPLWASLRMNPTHVRTALLLVKSFLPLWFVERARRTRRRLRHLLRRTPGGATCN